MSSLRTFQQLQRVARDRKRPVDEMVTLYGLERFLARLGQTSYAEDFCLKGGVLLSAHALRRPTRDIDLQALDFTVDVEHLAEVVAAVAAVAADDHLELDEAAMRVEQIRDEDEYTGLRIALPATVHRAKITVKVDVSTGDPIWPEPEPIELPGLLGEPVRMMGHPLVTVIAEKTVTMLQRGISSTRWRDLVDVQRMAGLYKFRGEDLRSASESVCAFRNVELGPLRGLMVGYGAVSQAKWAAWRRRYDLQEICHSDLDHQVGMILDFIDPVFDGSVGVESSWDPDSYNWS